jgi:hypothetical protein
MLRGKSGTKMWATAAIFKKTAQRKQSPIGRKFAKSGHPDSVVTFSTAIE